MATFLVLSTMANGISVFRTWMDAIGDNLANLNTVRSTDEAAFQARYVVAEAVDYVPAGVSGAGTGIRVAGIEYGSAEGRPVHTPDHPPADADGMRRIPDTARATPTTRPSRRTETRRVRKEGVGKDK